MSTLQEGVTPSGKSLVKQQELNDNHTHFEPSDDNDEDCGTSIKKVRKCIQRFSDSDSDLEKPGEHNNVNIFTRTNSKSNSESDDDDFSNILKNNLVKTRLKTIANDNSDSDSQEILREKNISSDYKSLDTDSNTDRYMVTKNVEQQNRMNNKRNKLKERFKSLLHSREKGVDQSKETISNENLFNENSDKESESSSEETSINKIKQIIQIRKSASMSICEPDTSDEETNQVKQNLKSKKQQKHTIPISPKPQRMSAKQALENMHKIKSESNRMLREKEVSLPYHRPKALRLKDIMSRRKPALSSDGKALPLKMNGEQLRKYALLLEQRQKEIMELCKSDTDDDEPKDELISIDTCKLNDQDKLTVLNVNTLSLDTDKINSEVKTALSVSKTIEGFEKTNIHTSSLMSENYIKSHRTLKSNADNQEISCDDNNFLNHDKSKDQYASDNNDSLEETMTVHESENIININSGSQIKCNEGNKENLLKTESIIKDFNNCIEELGSIPTNTGVMTEQLEFQRKFNNDTHSKNTNNSEKDSQLISWQYDDTEIDIMKLHEIQSYPESHIEKVNNSPNKEIEKKIVDGFPDDDADMDDINSEDIDSIIEKSEILKDAPLFGAKPKLTGGPGMIIDLDGSNSVAPKKLTGVELLKQRFTFFAQMKTPEEMERGREKRQKPGTQHIKLKQELEDQIAEQRSLEWAKRLENEKQPNEPDSIRGDDYDAEDDYGKNCAKMEEQTVDYKESLTDSEEELLEDDVLIEDKPRKKNPLLEDEAEESEEEIIQNGNKTSGNENDATRYIEQNAVESEEEEEYTSEEDESSESEADADLKPKKGRILKAFEDSDDEETLNLVDKSLKSITEDKTKNLDDLKSLLNPCNEKSKVAEVGNVPDKPIESADSQESNNANIVKTNIPNEITESQDDVLQLAQVPSTISEELFTSQESSDKSLTDKVVNPIIENSSEDADLGSQTFSILNSNTAFKNNMDLDQNGPEKLSVISETQPFDDNLDAVVGMCSGSFSQNFIEFQPSQSQSQSQIIGQDVLDMCTGKFYDNQFLSQIDENDGTSTDMTQDLTLNNSKVDEINITQKKNEYNDKEKQLESNVLISILDELNEPETSRPLKYFVEAKSQNKENENNMVQTQLKKKFVIDSEDEMNENSVNTEQKRRKKLKKKKPEKRALQISDDEADYSEPDGEGSLSENDSINNDEEEKLIEYDSEENEIEIKPQYPKKKRKATEFFEQEAELTSEDEWIGSGDEDEAGLDRMEREAGDDDAFNQGQLQRELGQIHMRDVLDQDKREVRLIQELLFEDGDLGAGGRQRKFRWRNADGEEENGTILDLADTQEEEFESEEQWRKQRHEREMFLRQMKNKNEIEEELNVTVNRTSIIKANLCSRTMSSLLEEGSNKTHVDTAKSPPEPEKKTAKDIPSPKKPFSILQQNYHGSLLTRGRGALARLAALATPLALDDDAPKIGHLAPSSKRNFVFAAIAPEDREPKVTKRKAETNVGTPQLVKKMKIEERKKQFKNSLIDHLKT